MLPENNFIEYCHRRTSPKKSSDRAAAAYNSILTRLFKRVARKLRICSGLLDRPKSRDDIHEGDHRALISWARSSSFLYTHALQRFGDLPSLSSITQFSLADGRLGVYGTRYLFTTFGRQSLTWTYCRIFSNSHSLSDDSVACSSEADFNTGSDLDHAL